MAFDDEEDDNPRHPNGTEETKHRNNFQYPTMVVIRDSSQSKNLLIFPPINHENLYLSLSPLSSSSSSSSLSSTSSFSPSDSDQSDPDTPIRRPTAEVTGWRWWMGIGLEALRLKALRLVSSSFGGNGVIFWKASGILVAVMIWSFWIRARYRRRVEDLVSAVKAKDKKINKLLSQIARLNEVLIARHRDLASKVPV